MSCPASRQHVSGNYVRYTFVRYGVPYVDGDRIPSTESTVRKMAGATPIRSPFDS